MTSGGDTRSWENCPPFPNLIFQADPLWEVTVGAVHSEGKGAAKDTGFGDGQRHRLDSRSSVWGQCSAEQLKACLKWTWSGETEFLAEAFSSKGLTDRAADTLGEARPTVCHLCKAALTAARSAKGRTDKRDTYSAETLRPL